MEAFDDFPAAVLDESGLVAIEVDLAYLLFQLFQRGMDKIFDRAVPGKDPRRYLVYEVVPGLSGEYEGNEQFQGTGKVEVEFGVRVGAIQPLDDLYQSVFI